MTKLRDLKDGDRARLHYTYEGVVELSDSRWSGVRLLNPAGESIFSCDFEEDDYFDLTVEVLGSHPKVGELVDGKTAKSLPDGSIVQMDGNEVIVQGGFGYGHQALSLDAPSREYRILYIPER